MFELPDSVTAKKDIKGWRLQPTSDVQDKVLVPDRGSEKLLKDRHLYEAVALVRDTAPGERRGVKILKVGDHLREYCPECSRQDREKQLSWLQAETRILVEANREALLAAVSLPEVQELAGLLGGSHCWRWIFSPAAWLEETLRRPPEYEDQLGRLKETIQEILAFPKIAAELHASLSSGFAEEKEEREKLLSGAKAAADALGAGPEIADFPKNWVAPLEEKLQLRILVEGRRNSRTTFLVHLYRFKWGPRIPGREYESPDGYGTRSFPDTPAGERWIFSDSPEILEEHRARINEEKKSYQEYLDDWEEKHELVKARRIAELEFQSSNRGKLDELTERCSKELRRIPRSSSW